MYGSASHLSLVSLLLTSIFIHHANGQNGTSPTSNLTISAPSAPADCHCGFQDPLTNSVYTDSVIVYFNETTSIPQDVFSVDAFEHPYERGFSQYYREGALAENVYFTEGEQWNLSPGWLNMNVSGLTPEQVVNGAQLQTVRQDIQYGTFRVFMRSPAPYAGGTSLTMRLQYNETSSTELDLLNMDDSTDDACMQTSTSNEDPLTSWGVNYTVLGEPQNNIGAWMFWEWRMDWDGDSINWFITPGGNGTYEKTRTVPTSNASLVDIPAAFFLKHWSLGDPNFMQGPPTNNSAASIGWVRMFFNSSVESNFAANSADCNATQYCSTDDPVLRVTTPYTEASTLRWMPVVEKARSRSQTVGIALCAASLAFSAALIVHALLRKWSNRRAMKRAGVPVGSRRPKMPTSPWPSSDQLGKHRAISQAWTSQTDLEMRDMKPGYAGVSSTTLLGGSGQEQKFPGMHGRTMSERPLLAHHDSTAASSVTAFTSTDKRMSYMSNLGPLRDADAIEPLGAQRLGTAETSHTVGSPYGTYTPAEASTLDLLPKDKAADPASAPIPEGSAAAANPGAKPSPLPAGLPQARARVDYLAGLVAVCSLLVSCTHFILTFTPSVIEEVRPQHYESEWWARRTIEPFLFNDIWVGLFLTTSTRFLTSGYLRTGNLKTVAEKVVCRTPRLMIPITAVILLEYFLMDIGAIHFLIFIPSITWSDWISTRVYPNFGWFFNETLQMIYLIPNAAPQIIGNYGTGVLWTIPVQLQFSWVSLLGAVIVREIKTPWKRFGYYAFCIINNWYAMSWGSYFWFGLMLADLDITYKYRKYIQARAWLHYAMLTTVSFLVLLSLANDLISIWTGWTFSTNERGIHPNPDNGLPIAQTSEAGYPEYIEPKLNGLIFAVGSQYVVELSPWLQWVLSRKIFLWLFPHVFTIYLIHGLVFWSIGSLVCVKFAVYGLPYWANMLLTAIISYTALFMILPILTPVMEMLGKEITKGIWVGASEEPAEWRPTGYPFSIEEIRSMVYRKDDEGRGAVGKGKGKGRSSDGHGSPPMPGAGEGSSSSDARGRAE